MMKKTIFTSILLLLLVFQVQSQGFLRSSGKYIVNEGGDTIQIRAMGLGGWMLQEGYMLQTSDFANAQHEIREKIEEVIGKDDTDLFYEKWLANHCQRSDIEAMASWGFNAVRLPMHYNLFTLPIEEEPVANQQTWLDKGFEMTDSLVAWCKDNDMYVLLDLHAAPGGQGYESGISDYDPDKPSLWERKANRDKTKALWKKLAERYAEEPTIMGYDLLNEPNWDIPGNALLRQLYKEITDSIRTVDTRHMIFIEGNWFANDFSGLTPPWDDNMVYSPHKYWSYNDQASIYWVLAIRDAYDVPVFFGESGENSNTWFTEAIRLFEDNHLGWAWWPLKKIESISCPLSIVKTPEYETLLEYWKGNAPKPDAAFAKAALFEMAENLKIDNCIYQKDVIDAMFRQVRDTTTIPYNTFALPGIVYASDFSLGSNGKAYFDNEVADYHLSTDSYTAWNQGWAYRNDGVDIQKLEDVINSNGLNVGWLGSGEWMQYDIDVTEAGVYDVKVRVASNSANGICHFAIDKAPATAKKIVPNSGGWDEWTFVTIPNLVLSEEDHKIEFHIDREGFNVSSFEFIRKGATTTLDHLYLYSVTRNASTIDLTLNKTVAMPLPDNPGGFVIRVNGSQESINSIAVDPQNPRTISLSIDRTLKSTDQIRISYNGNEIMATDASQLQPFTNKVVDNTLTFYHPIPGKIEAEDYHAQVGLSLETCTDIGGGQNIAYLGSGDYADYYIDVAKAGIYNVEYRTAAQNNTGKITLQWIKEDGSSQDLHTVSFAPTGGWQSWKSTFASLELEKGRHRIRLLIQASDFNINWFDFSFLSSVKETERDLALKVFPNPSQDIFRVDIPKDYSQTELKMMLWDQSGSLLLEKTNSKEEHVTVDLSSYPNGWYLLAFFAKHQVIAVEKLMKN
jgi:endoglucanase